MRFNKELRNNLSHRFRSFCKHCTLHGFYYFSEKHSWRVHSTWMLIISFSVALCTFLGHMIWQKFIIDPTFTVVESTHYPISKIPFPAVTVCDAERVYGPNTKNISDILVHRGFNPKQIAAFYDSITGIREKDYVPEEFERKMHSLLYDLGFTFDVLIEMLKKPCGVLLVQCVWRSRPFECAHMFRQVYTAVGYCCRFDIAYFKYHADEETNLLSGVEVTEALDIVVNGQKVSATGQVTDGYVLLYVFDDNNFVTLADNPITLTPAGYFDVNIDVWTIDSSKDVEVLDMNIRKCLLESDMRAGARFYQACITLLILKKAVSYCQCLPFNYTAQELQVEDYGPCTWNRLICIYRTIDTVQSEARADVEQLQCLQKCDYVEYDTDIDYIRNQRSFHRVNESYSRVVVHFAANTCMKYRREVLYTWDQMLANLGGIFGLCLGGSVISVIELLWFLVELLLTVIANFRHKRTTHKGENTLIFTLTQRDLVSKVRENKRGRVGSRYRFVN